MKKFKFRLQAALDLRRQREEQLKIQLTQVQARLQEEILQLKRLEEERELALRDSMERRKGKLNPQEIQRDEHHLFVLEERIANQKHLLTVVEGEVTAKKAEVLTASQETSALEKLRDQHEEQYRKQALMEEQKFLDELASIRNARQQMSGS